MEIRNNLTKELIDKHLRRLDSERYTKTNSCSCSNYLKLFFYEWSNVYQTPKTFNKYYEFFDFCRESKIEIDPDLRTRLYQWSTIFATCKKNEPVLIASETYGDLIHQLENKNAVIDPNKLPALCNTN